MRRALMRFGVHPLVVFAACASASRAQTPRSAAAEATDARATGVDAAPPAPVSALGAADAGHDAAAIGSERRDRGGDADFDAARARFDSGDQAGARAALEAFLSAHPTHPSRAAAQLLLGRLALLRGDPAAAKNVLAPLTVSSGDAAAIATARYYLGLAELRLGNAPVARQLLTEFMPRRPTTVTASDDAGIELRGALAEASAAADPLTAIDLWDVIVRVGREHERAWARHRAIEVGGRLAPDAAWRAWGAAPQMGLARAVLGAEAAGYLRARGDASGAAFIDGETNAARHALGFEVAGPRVGPGDPTRFGLALPLSGKFQVVGEAALRAAMIAGGAPAGVAGAAAGSTQLVVRDTATDAERAARGVDELTRTEAVIGIVGAPSSKSGSAGNAAITQASQDGIALLALDGVPPGALTTAFQMVHAPEARATALARYALRIGVRRFALLGPDSAASKRLREAFRRAVVDGGGKVVTESSYVAGATSFTAAVAPLKKTTAEAIFVPDNAERLPLIAPALAVADLWPQPWNRAHSATARPGSSGGKDAGKDKDQPRPVLLLSTANELSHKLVESAGRYVQGALLCPGFYADEADPQARGFADAYRNAYGHDPHATEAYAYDAVATLRSAVKRGARTRGDVVRMLAASGGAPVLQGLTGNVAFGPDHGRVDSPIVYVVDGDEIHATK